MDAKRFDAIAQSVAFSRDRRGVVQLLAGSALGGLVLAGASGTDAKRKKRKKKKITICHNGQTISVSKKAKKGHLKHGDTLGDCPPPDLCKDGTKNQNESDVDCGGVCPRCTRGKACLGSADCDTSICKAGVCEACETALDCGDGLNGEACGCRDDLRKGYRVCTGTRTKFVPGGNCEADCQPNELCSEGGTGNIECFLPCGQ